MVRDVGVAEDLALPVAGLGGLALILWHNRRILVPATAAPR